MSKDDNFIRLLEDIGPPPAIIWITTGNSSNARMRHLLQNNLNIALRLIKSGEKLIEIGDQYLGLKDK